MEDDYMLMGLADDDANKEQRNDGDEGRQTEETNDPTLVADPTAIAGTKRRPQVKLTTERLLSDKGLPYVMQHAPKRLRISKSRNAHDNLSHIVQFYQLWAHELYPKAKFRDFIKLCQTLGKSDRVLREYRMDLFKREMGIPTSSDIQWPEEQATQQEKEPESQSSPDDLYTVPLTAHAEAETTQSHPNEEDELMRDWEANNAKLRMQDLEAQADGLEEDPDALDLMREYGM